MIDPWSEAWEEAEASAPPDVILYPTLELQHPAFIEGSPSGEMPIRIVAGPADDMAFGIEDGADFNSGEMATFQAVNFEAEHPEFAEGRMPECQINIDNVGRELIPYLEQAVQIKSDLTVLFRQYRSDDLTQPCYGPVRFVMRRVKVAGSSVTGVAQLDDLSNSKFPRGVYTATDFPGLLA